MGLVSDTVTLLSSGNHSAASGTGTAVDFSGYRSGIMYVNLTTLSGGTSPTVMVYLQVSNDGGTTWAGSATTSPVALGTALSATGLGFDTWTGVIGGLVRAAWTNTGTPTNATFSVSATLEKIK